MTPMEAAVKIHKALVETYGTENTVDLVLWDAEKCAEMGYGTGEVALVWEGAPINEWAIQISGTRAAVNLPGVLAEPYNGHILNFSKN